MLVLAGPEVLWIQVVPMLGTARPVHLAGVLRSDVHN